LLFAVILCEAVCKDARQHARLPCYSHLFSVFLCVCGGFHGFRFDVKNLLHYFRLSQLLKMITFDEKICTDIEESTSREWLETNGIGGFACGSISGINTRRYHSLLTASLCPPVGRIRLLSKFEETLFIGDEVYHLSANQYQPNVIFPQGYKHIKSFCLNPFPTWTFRINDVEIEKTVFMVQGKNTVFCRYRLISKPKPEIFLELKPLVCTVDYHVLQRENSAINSDFECDGDSICYKPYPEKQEIFFTHNAESVEKTGYWYRNFEYQIEKERGFDFHEDLFQPFLLRFDLSKAPAIVACGTSIEKLSEIEKLEKEEIKRRENLIENAKPKDEFEKELVLAADKFIVSRNQGYSVIAGYPWFADWGRDTMISLKGLTLETNRFDIARSIILEFSKYISQGMIPNRFPDQGEEPEYNTADATLWYFEAIRAYAETTGDYDLVRNRLYEKLADIIAWHLRGTRFQIHVDTDGLLFVGEENSQLTWMDAKVDGVAVTPRVGKPVEIQALWFNALKTMSAFAEKFGSYSEKMLYDSMAEAARYSFNQLFWNKEEDCLFDVVSNGERDATIRPNQIFAASLHFSMLDMERSRKVVEKVERELLTPFGLRTLSPRDKNYHPRYVGSPNERDSAYHQGTVWPWLLGAFADAYMKVFPEREEKIAELLSAFRNHIEQAGLGQISEIFDAEPPYSPRGCLAQAWSVAEIMRLSRKYNGKKSNF